MLIFHVQYTHSTSLKVIAKVCTLYNHTCTYLHVRIHTAESAVNGISHHNKTNMYNVRWTLNVIKCSVQGKCKGVFKS